MDIRYLDHKSAPELDRIFSVVDEMKKHLDESDHDVRLFLDRFTMCVFRAYRDRVRRSDFAAWLDDLLDVDREEGYLL